MKWRLTVQITAYAFRVSMCSSVRERKEKSRNHLSIYRVRNCRWFRTLRSISLKCSIHSRRPFDPMNIN